MGDTWTGRKKDVGKGTASSFVVFHLANGRRNVLSRDGDVF